MININLHDSVDLKSQASFVMQGIKVSDDGRVSTFLFNNVQKFEVFGG